MNRKAAVIAMLLGSTISCAGAATDDEIKHGINYAYRIFDNPSFQDAVFKEAMRSCEYDTNRFERLLSEIACDSLTNAHPRYARYAISDIGSLGTTNSLPFLYSCATNAVVGGEAMLAAAKIGGISGEYISHLNEFLAESPADKEGKAYCCEFVLSAASSQGISAVDRTNLCSIVVRHASENNDGPRTMDDSISAFDHAYVHSRRRLAVMRSLQMLELNALMQTFVSNTINELVTYPESALGD